MHVLIDWISFQPSLRIYAVVLVFYNCFLYIEFSWQDTSDKESILEWHLFVYTEDSFPSFNPEVELIESNDKWKNSNSIFFYIKILHFYILFYNLLLCNETFCCILKHQRYGKFILLLEYSVTNAIVHKCNEIIHKEIFNFIWNEKHV